MVDVFIDFAQPLLSSNVLSQSNLLCTYIYIYIIMIEKSYLIDDYSVVKVVTCVFRLITTENNIYQ